MFCDDHVLISTVPVDSEFYQIATGWIFAYRHRFTYNWLTDDNQVKFFLFNHKTLQPELRTCGS